jgi:hypothetical protein
VSFCVKETSVFGLMHIFYKVYYNRIYNYRHSFAPYNAVTFSCTMASMLRTHSAQEVCLEATLKANEKPTR